MQEISAGGVVYRINKEQIEILLIHDRFGAITLPKGKQELGETIKETALREIEEETGVIGEIVTKIQTISYEYTHSKHGKIEKEVTYYLVKTNTKALTPQIEEIDAVLWYSIQEAIELHQAKGYANNQSVLEQAIQYLIKKGAKS
jgi:diadenosine hexaphosphate hydrolase (ATP-forming)